MGQKEKGIRRVLDKTLYRVAQFSGFQATSDEMATEEDLWATHGIRKRTKTYGSAYEKLEKDIEHHQPGFLMRSWAVLRIMVFSIITMATMAYAVNAFMRVQPMNMMNIVRARYDALALRAEGGLLGAIRPTTAGDTCLICRGNIEGRRRVSNTA